jgi:hypothetical protein
MLRLFLSIFGNEPGAHRYSETRALAAIERAVGGSGP